MEFFNHRAIDFAFLYHPKSDCFYHFSIDLVVPKIKHSKKSKYNSVDVNLARTRSRLLCSIFKDILGYYIFRLDVLLLFDDNKIKMARKPRKKQKENSVGCTGEGKRL